MATVKKLLPSSLCVRWLWRRNSTQTTKAAKPWMCQTKLRPQKLRKIAKVLTLIRRYFGAGIVKTSISCLWVLCRFEMQLKLSLHFD